MPASFIIAGFTLGLAGSLHCVGMCGPLSMALPVHHLSRAGKLFALLLYQAGRIITYAGIGLLFGLMGRQLYFAGYQQTFSIIAGSVILILAVLYFIQKRNIRLSFLSRFYQGVQLIIIRLLKSSVGLPGFVLLGMANGLLPCGMVYIALAASLSMQTLAESVSFMAMFGAGTLPAMLLTGYAGILIKPELKNSFRKITPFLISLMGIVLILRGLNLGIPYLSPELPVSPDSPMNCQP